MLQCKICDKSFGFADRGKLLSCSVIKVLLHLSYSCAISSAMGSSQFRFCSHSVWMTCFFFSKMLLRVTRKPRLVAGLSATFIMNPWVSSLTFYFTPSALSLLRFPSFRSLSFIPSFPGSFGITLSTLIWLLVNFLKLNPFSEHSALTLFTISLVALPSGKLLSMSST